MYEIVKNKQRLTRGLYELYNKIKRCSQIHPGHTQAKCTYKEANRVIFRLSIL